ncbi:hypothetical protein ACPB9E_12915 [Streptomyces exfoliatus]|uniref:hypothetical protein n=1 Tax=Streptomyces exfoliatus TaxID=1905 RepID=UPI003C2EA13B
MQRTVINGIPLYWDDVPGPFRAWLVLGAGIEDEPFTRLGITDLALQLAVTAVRESGVRVDGVEFVTEVQDCSVLIDGDPEQVAEAVNRLCRVLADLPVDGLAEAVRLVSARKRRERSWEDLQERELLDRYGLRGIGKIGWGFPALGAVGADDLRAWAAERFTRANAALALSGPPPKALDPRLPDGPRLERPVVHPLPGTTGHWTAVPEGFGMPVAVSFEVPRPPAGVFSVEVARNRAARDPRVARNVIGEVEILGAHAGGGRSFCWLVAQTDAEGVAEVAEGFDAVLRELAANGPTDAEVRDVERVWNERLDTGEARFRQLTAAAWQHLVGQEVQDVALVRDRLASFGPGVVRAALAAYPSTAVLTVPEGCEPGPDLPFEEVTCALDENFHEGHEYRPRLFGPVGRSERMYLSDEGLMHWTEGHAHGVRWHRVAGLGIFPSGARRLFGENGACIDFAADWYKSGRDLVSAVDSRVPAALHFPMDEAEPI